MHDHVKSAIRDFNSDHNVLHYGTNDLSSERAASKIATSVIELVL